MPPAPSVRARPTRDAPRAKSRRIRSDSSGSPHWRCRSGQPAAESPDGLTQASIINAARNLDYAPSVVQEGIHYKMAGEQDSVYVEDVQIVQYDAAATVWNNVGELITEFASS